MSKKKTQPNSSSLRGGYRENAQQLVKLEPHRYLYNQNSQTAMPSQLVELARRLDNGEIIDTDTESKSSQYDSVTKSNSLGADRFNSPTYQADKEARIDAATESNRRNHDSVTESIIARTQDASVADQLDKLVDIDIDTKSKSGDYDNVTESNISSSHSLSQLACEPELANDSDNDTESRSRKNDNVTESSWGVEHQTLTQSIPDLNEALSLALTIIKAKKSARESIARLLSKLYSTQVCPDDLSKS